MKVLLVSLKHPALTSDEFQEGDGFVSASGFITKGIISTFGVSASKMLELPIATTSYLTNNKIPPFWHHSLSGTGSMVTQNNHLRPALNYALKMIRNNFAQLPNCLQ